MLKVGKKQTESTVGYADKISAHFVYSIVVQIILFYICNIWLNYLPSANLFFLSHTYLFGLYLAYKLPKLISTPQPESLKSIILHIKSHLEQYVGYIKIKGIEYLLIIFAFYHMPALLSLTMTYIILSQSYGHEQTESILHIPLLILCSMFSLAEASYWGFPFIFLLAPCIITLMFSEFSILKPSEFITELQSSKLKIYQLAKSAEPTDCIILSIILLSLFTPMMQLIPFWYLYPVLSSTPITGLKVTIAAYILGERCEFFASDSIEPGKFDQLVGEVKTQFMPAAMSMFTTNSSQPTI